MSNAIPAQRPIATVFGASGFVARYIVGQLTKLGYSVRAASRHPSKSRHLRPLGAVGQVELVYAPIQETDKVAAAVKGAQVVVNCVGILAPSGGTQTFDATMATGPATLAQICSQAGVDRLIHISALGAAADAPSAYGRAKAAGEHGVMAAFPEATILRPSIIFGAEDSFFNRFAAMPFVPLIGGGQTLFQPVYVADLAQALANCITDDLGRGQVFEVAGPEILSFRECMEAMCDAMGEARPLVHVPWGVAQIMGAFGSLLPTLAPITSDQVKSLGVDNIQSGEFAGLEALGVTATDLRAILPIYLDTYRAGGKLGAFHA